MTRSRSTAAVVAQYILELAEPRPASGAREGAIGVIPNGAMAAPAGIILSMNSTSSPTPLRRSTTDKKISGVAGGLADHLGLDPTLVRAGFAVSILFSGAGLVAYLLLLAIVPNDDAMPAAASPAVAA